MKVEIFVLVYFKIFRKKKNNSRQKWLKVKMGGSCQGDVTFLPQESGTNRTSLTHSKLNRVPRSCSVLHI